MALNTYLIGPIVLGDDYKFQGECAGTDPGWSDNHYSYVEGTGISNVQPGNVISNDRDGYTNEVALC